MAGGEEKKGGGPAPHEHYFSEGEWLECGAEEDEAARPRGGGVDGDRLAAAAGGLVGRLGLGAGERPRLGAGEGEAGGGEVVAGGLGDAAAVRGEAQGRRERRRVRRRRRRRDGRCWQG